MQLPSDRAAQSALTQDNRLQQKEEPVMPEKDIALHSMDTLDALGRVIAALKLCGRVHAAREIQRQRDALAASLHSIACEQRMPHAIATA